MPMAKLRLIFGSLLLIALVAVIGFVVVRQSAVNDLIARCMGGNEELRAFCVASADRNASVIGMVTDRSE